MRSKSTPGLRQRGNSFEAYVWDPASKRKIRETFATKAAAQNWLIDNRKKVKDGKLRAGDNKLTVAAWLNTWIDKWAPLDASEDVVHLYRQSVEDHIVPELGHVRLTKLRRAECNELVHALFKKGQARNTIKRTVTPLRLALSVAVDEEKIGANPAADLKIPEKAPTRELHVPTLAEVRRILDHASEDGRDAILLVASLGLRRGEMLALRWSDVDFKSGVVHVRRQNKRGLIVENTKTKAGTRAVPLYASARTMLEARANRLNLTRQWLAKDERLIFPNSIGGPFEPTNWSRRVWEPAREAAGLEDVRLHDLRHFAVTALREGGMDNKLRSVVTGHTDTRTTETLYDHVRPEHIEAAAKTFDPLAG